MMGRAPAPSKWQPRTLVRFRKLCKVVQMRRRGKASDKDVNVAAYELSIYLAYQGDYTRALSLEALAEYVADQIEKR